MSPAPQHPVIPQKAPGAAGEATCAPVRRVMTIRNQRGLHARAAAKFVRCAENFDADVVVQRQGVEVPGLSIMGLMMLAAAPGCCIEVTARGPQAEAAVAAIAALVEDKFGEGE